MCIPEVDTLSLNGPRPARMLRVMIRVTTNVTTNAAKHRNSAMRFLAMIVSWNQVPTGCEGTLPGGPRGGRDGTVRHGRVRGGGPRRPHHDGSPGEAQRVGRRAARRPRRRRSSKPSGDPDVHAVVLAGNGPSFCSGYDLGGSRYATAPEGGWDLGNTVGTLRSDRGRLPARSGTARSRPSPRSTATPWPAAATCSCCATSPSPPPTPSSGTRP